MTSQKTVLLVDDDPDSRESLKDLLEFEGHKVVCAQDGAEAIALAHATRFDAVLMDIRMPVLGGLEAHEKMRSKLRNDGSVVMLMTAYSAPNLVQAALKQGVNSVMQKPIQIETVLAQIRPNDPHRAA